MKKRYIYSILFTVPGFFIALIIAFFIFAAISGFLWIFIYGDNPWPPSIEKLLSALFACSFLMLWFALIIIGFIVGKRLEQRPNLNKKHILTSAAITLLALALIVLHQINIGNLGQQTESQLCSEFCRSQGHSASGLNAKDAGERICSCINSEGHAVITIPLLDITAE